MREKWLVAFIFLILFFISIKNVLAPWCCLGSGGSCTCSSLGGCTYTCNPGWFNDDGIVTNGCENQAPKWFTPSENKTNPNTGEAVMFSVNWTDAIGTAGKGLGINYTWFSWNASGANCNTWVNISFTARNNVNSTWHNETQTIPAACSGKKIAWKQYANDSAGEINVSQERIITVQVIQAPQYSLNSTNSTLAGTAVSHNLKWNDDTGLSGFHFLFHNGSYSWFTPLSVHSFCGEVPPYNASNTIDNNLGSDWEDASAHEHWIAYDFGVPLNISKVRVYTDPPNSLITPCAIVAIYVTNDTNNFGSSLGSCVLTGTETTWRECSFSPKLGRYIKIVLNTTDSNNVCTNTTYLTRFYEFQVYSEFVVDPWKAFTSEMCPNPYTECWSNVTKVINSTVGATIKWYVYTNDTSNNWNVSEIFSYVTTSIAYLEVNLTSPPLSYTISQNYSFWVNATVTCKNGNCGTVYGTVRYNSSSTYPNTPINTTQGAEPFYVVDSWNNSFNTGITNQISCGSLNQGQTCNLSWLINATGLANTYWKIGVLFNSSQVQENHTENSTIYIVECLEDMNLSWVSIDFGQLIPDTPASYNPAPGNANKLYNITNKGTCTLNLWIKGTDLQNSTLNSVIKVGNLTWSNYSNEYNSNWVYPMSYSYLLLFQGLSPGLNLTTYYWLTVPPVYSGIYKGIITICGNYSTICKNGG